MNLKFSPLCTADKFGFEALPKSWSVCTVQFAACVLFGVLQPYIHTYKKFQPTWKQQRSMAAGNPHLSAHQLQLSCHHYLLCRCMPVSHKIQYRYQIKTACLTFKAIALLVFHCLSCLQDPTLRAYIDKIHGFLPCS